MSACEICGNCDLPKVGPTACSCCGLPMNALSLVAIHADGWGSHYTGVGRRCHVCEHCDPRPADILPHSHATASGLGSASNDAVPHPKDS